MTEVRRSQVRYRTLGFKTLHDGTTGICGTCCAVLRAVDSDEGYSHCCNDRIEYGMEAVETIDQFMNSTSEDLAHYKRRVASLASQRSRGKDVGRELEETRRWVKIAKAELKRLAITRKKFA